MRMHMTYAYRLGLYEKALPNDFSIAEKLHAAKGAGYDFLEMSIDESDEKLARLHFSRQDRVDIVKAMHEAQLPIRTMCLSAHRRFPLGSRDKSVQNRAMDIMRSAIDLAAGIGIRIIQLAGYDVYYEDSDEITQENFYQNLVKAVNYAAEHGVILGFETMETPFMDTVSKTMKAISFIDSPYLGVYPDIGNLANAAQKYGHDLITDLAVGNGHILAAHLKETLPGVYRNMRFGAGHTPYGPCLCALLSQGVRLFTAEFWQADGDNTDYLPVAAEFLRGKLETAVRQLS